MRDKILRPGLRVLWLGDQQLINNTEGKLSSMVIWPDNTQLMAIQTDLCGCYIRVHCAENKPLFLSLNHPTLIAGTVVAQPQVGQHSLCAIRMVDIHRIGGYLNNVRI